MRVSKVRDLASGQFRSTYSNSPNTLWQCSSASKVPLLLFQEKDSSWIDPKLPYEVGEKPARTRPNPINMDAINMETLDSAFRRRLSNATSGEQGVQ